MALARQSTLSKQTAAVFDQTIDELQTYVGPGKPVGSMNLEEFLQAFWDKGGHNSWDRDHEFRLPAEVSSPSGPRDTMQSAASISSSVPEDLRGMSVEEVWQHISQHNSGGFNGASAPEGDLGRVTVSNFLQSVGMELTASPRSAAAAGPGSNFGRGPAPVSMQLPNPPQLQVRVDASQARSASQDSGRKHTGYAQHNRRPSPQPSTPETPQRRKGRSPAAELPVPNPYLSTAPNLGAASQDAVGLQSGSRSASDTAAAEGQEAPATNSRARQRKRKAEPEVTDERTERMQKRMVKNRESAARSRQKKQQYTFDLETQVQNLKLQNRQLLEKVIHACAPPPPRILPCVEGEPLRRTRSGNL